MIYCKLVYSVINGINLKFLFLNWNLCLFDIVMWQSLPRGWDVRRKEFGLNFRTTAYIKSDAVQWISHENVQIASRVKGKIANNASLCPFVEFADHICFHWLNLIGSLCFASLVISKWPVKYWWVAIIQYTWDKRNLRIQGKLGLLRLH